VLQLASSVAVTNTSTTWPLPVIPATPRPELAWVSITGNPKLSGTLPRWSNALGLRGIDLSNNAFTGSLPDTWPKLTGVESISVAGNNRSGSISSAWARTPATSSLALLNISGNVGMKGCLLDAQGQPGTYFPFIDAKGTSLNCQKSKAAVAASSVPEPGWSPAACKVDGYSFRPQQLPSKWEQWQSVTLYTLHPKNTPKEVPLPLPTLAATKAACDALDACTMFTSDGYLIGVYRVSLDSASMQETLENERRLGPWQWKKMAYCRGKCCGTWVSSAVNTAALASNQTSQTREVSSDEELPRAGAYIGLLAYRLTEAAAKQCRAMQLGNINDVTASTCPKRCRVSCCTEAEQYMSDEPFLQCSEHECRLSCGFNLVQISGVSTPYTKKTVALYLAQKSKGKPPQTGGRRTDGPSKECTGLC
jgi:hypothetical protein